jgi:AcrR family transcriptional regulator
MPKGKATGSKTARRDLERRIVDHTVALAAEAGWDRIRLRRVADDLGISLAELRVHYRDLDAVADAWFARALARMLAPAEAGFTDLPARERVYLVMIRWLDAHRDERAIVGQMLNTKLYPSHPHHWVPMIFSLSRLIQWVREAAHLDASGRRRQVEEVGLTLLFLATLGVWLRDQSADQETTRRFLRHRLAMADRLLALAARTPVAREAATDGRESTIPASAKKKGRPAKGNKK